MADKIQTLPGFRDFYPDGCAIRNYVFEHWRSAAARYGFVEYETPILESTDLYRKKSGDEITGQLFCFEDKGEREVAMRPEITPGLARMATARARDFKKPLKWFEIGQCFRYEKRQKGRTREFYQFNCDILGEESPAADAELVALAVDLMRGFGFDETDFCVRLSDRRVWPAFAESEGVADVETLLRIVDKWEREKPDTLAAKLTEIGTSYEAVAEFMKGGSSNDGPLSEVLKNLEARGLASFVKADYGIVRGLAYYTGTVFEVFDLKRGMRAIAGGGRYDGLCELIGGKGAAMPACGFAMGDVVIADLISETPAAKAELTSYLSEAFAFDVYVVIADEEKRPEALGLVQKLRTAGFRTEYPLSPAKVGKQFQAAETLQARIAVVVGAEFPSLKVKVIADRSESEVEEPSLIATLESLRDAPPEGPLLA